MKVKLFHKFNLCKLIKEACDVKVVSRGKRTDSINASALLHSGGIVSVVALGCRLRALPPSWVLSLRSLEKRPKKVRNIEIFYDLFRLLSIGIIVRDFIRRQPSILLITTVAICETIINSRIRGFHPYYWHLYVLCLGYSGQEHNNLRIHLLASIPSLIYSCSGLVKLLNSPDWWRTGNILKNAVLLYGGHSKINDFLSQHSLLLSRIILFSEILAFPLGQIHAIGLLLTAFGGLIFHLVCWRILKISFWHLALFNIPIVCGVLSK